MTGGGDSGRGGWASAAKVGSADNMIPMHNVAFMVSPKMSPSIKSLSQIVSALYLVIAELA